MRWETRGPAHSKQIRKGESKKMMCENCGVQGLPEESRFCASCGTRLSSSTDGLRTESIAPIEQVTESLTNGARVARAEARTGLETLSATPPPDQATPLPVSYIPEVPERMPGVAEAAEEAHSEEIMLAGFWRRVGGRFVDSLIVLAIGIVPAIAIYFVVYDAVLPNGFYTQADVELADGSATMAAIGFYIVFGAFYAIAGWASGGTPGMRAVGLRLQAKIGKASPGFGRAVARLLVSIVSVLALFLGFIGMVWSKERQTWHDAAAGTVVVESR